MALEVPRLARRPRKSSPLGSVEASTLSRVDLVERDAESSALRAQWARARAGEGGVVLVMADSGGGKTSLVREFTRSLMAQADILWGSCDPLATPRPLGPLLDVSDRLDAETRALLEGAGQAHQIYASVFNDLRVRPRVLVVDDLHWADQGTIDLLRFLLRRIGTTNALVVGTVRPDEIAAEHPLRALLGEAARSPDSVAIDLRPLSGEAVRTLVEDRPIDSERLHAITGGNPFFVTQMLDHDGDDLPRTVRDAILGRTAGLEPAARDLLDLLVCAREAIPDRLLPALGVGVEPLRSAYQAGLIRRSQRGVAFQHDLCRQAIASVLPPGAEGALHRRMLDALEADESAAAAVLVHHALGAGDAERVRRYGTEAGVTAARIGAHTEAADFFGLTLDHGKLAAADEVGLLERLAQEQYILDRLDDAIDSATQALTLRQQVADVASVSMDHQALATYEWYRADREAADRHAANAVAVLGTADEPVVRGHALALQAYLAMQSNDLETAQPLLEEASAAAGQSNDWALGVRTRLLAGIGSMLESKPAARDTVLEIVEPAVSRMDEIHSSGFSNLAYLDVEQRRLPEAAAVLGVSLPLTLEFDLPICHVWQLGARGRLALLQGDWTAADDDAGEVLTRRSAPLARTWAHLIRGLVQLRRTADAGADLDDAWDFASRLGEPLRLMPAASALAERVWLTGVADARVDEAVSLLRRFDGVGLEWARGDLAVWLRRIDPDVAVDNLELSAPHRLQLTGAHAAAAAAWDRLDAVYDEALALVETEEPDAFRRGLDLLDRLGADAVSARLRQQLRDRGVANVPSRRRTSTLENAVGLTARELEVLALLDGGLTNAELAAQLFIAPKTADHHVSSILGKLQVGSRREAVRAARDRGILA
jgi:DNA-binding CsgD family transcriptional regulator